MSARTIANAPSLRKLQAENYKSLRNVAVELGPINVLVGPNASGKSNLLDVVRFLGDSARRDLAPALDRRGGFERVRFRGKPTGPIRITVEATVTEHSSTTAPDEYTLSVSLAKARATGDEETARVLVRRESITFKRTRGRGRRITVQGTRLHIVDEQPRGRQQTLRLGLQPHSLGLATLPRLSDREGGEGTRRIAELFSTFRVFDVDVRWARRPAPLGVGKTLRSNGANLAPFFYRLSQEDERLFSRLIQDARELVPGLQNIHFVPVGGAESALSLELEEKGLNGATNLAEASYGTIRALGLLALLYDPNPPLLTCVEEIDHGLHPYVFDLLVERLREASSKTQFLIATHSPALVNRLKAEELIVCERDETGASRIPAISSALVKDMERTAEGELGLGELWFTGSLGGVPR